MKLLDVIDSFFSELEGNQRLRIGSYLVVTLVAISTIMELKDANRILTMQYRSLDETKFDLESVDEDSIWRARHEKELEYKEALSKKLWSAPSENQVLASIQSNLRQLAANIGLEDFSLVTGTPDWHDEIPKIKQVRSRLSIRFRNDEGFRLIESIESSSPIFLIERLKIDADTGGQMRGSSMSMDVLAFYLSD